VEQDNRFCGGLILNANHILTAASCVMDRNFNLLATSNLLVRGGNLVLASTEILRVSRIFVHRQYNPFNHLNNLAVLRLEVAINFANSTYKAADLNSNIVPETSECEVPGWYVNNGQALQNLQYTITNVTNRDMCSNVVQQILGESMICAAVATDQAAVCEVSFPRQRVNVLFMSLNSIR
jgi:trypsin